MPNSGKIPRPTIKRLSLYRRELEGLAAANRMTISSRQLGEVLGLTDAQVRKDLAYFGQFGHPGIGYRVPELIAELRKILGTDRSWRTAVVGAGNIGRAILNYFPLAGKGFEIVAAFDNDPAIIGTVIGGHHVHRMEEVDALIRDRDVHLAMLAVPGEVAQQVADQLIEAGIRGILNFAPVRLQVGDAVSIVSVDLTLSLEQLAFKVSLGLTATRDERESGMLDDASPSAAG
jgi:redox-sensing transcriptional repressor